MFSMVGFMVSVVIMVLAISPWGEALLMLGLMSALMVMSGGDYHAFCSSSGFEVDMMSYSLILLSAWVTLMALLGSAREIDNSGSFLSVCLILLFFLVLSFSALNYLFFYISFEASLIPVFVLILGWGYQPERIQAGLYMLFYTILASLPLLLSLVWLGTKVGSGFMAKGMIELPMSGILVVSFIFAFLVKFPMYVVHLWLPKAHLEAPVAGSMLLAGVMLKLGGYGLARVMPLMGMFSPVWVSGLAALSLWGGAAVGIICMRQIDMKSLVAYSSVVHMSGCIVGLLSMSEVGYKGAIIMMVGHGLCSSGLFYMSYLVYLRTSSRSMLVSKGLLNLLPSMSLWWFMLAAANMSAPPTIALLGELNLIISILSFSKVSGVLLAAISFMSGAYSVYLFSLSQHGEFLYSKKGYHSGSVVEFVTVVMHWVPLNLLILSSIF
uniref:NADH-ubiquinone oxidoreductase chain 4 n=1 Tax=Bactrurus brachycaudus TaxID=111554 RepID=A0A6C0X555_9CRUS|nr:NADH dehydrogenase subunit 4 [Bactrurus brachycaudus]QIC54387.1 NADH dehydrogenase subunit 4 [Bactrurus brachycaudus]